MRVTVTKSVRQVGTEIAIFMSNCSLKKRKVNLMFRIIDEESGPTGGVGTGRKGGGGRCIPPPVQRLNKNVANDLAVHVRQAEIASGVTIGEFGVIDAHLIQHGGMQVVDGDIFFH